LTGSCEKRGLSATEGKRKSEDIIAGAASVWPSRVEQMVKEVRPVAWLCFRIYSRHDAVAAITSGSSRIHGERRP
jgi:hypothetical protein